MEKQQDIMCHSKDSLISRTTKFRQFQLAIFVSFVTISFALCQGWPCCLSEFYLNRTSNFKVTFQTITSYENYCVWPQHLFTKRTNHKLRKKLPNQKCHKDIWNSNTILCTNLQTLYTGGLECLLCRLCFLL